MRTPDGLVDSGVCWTCKFRQEPSDFEEESQDQDRQTDDGPTQIAKKLTVAVIIPAHNYGEYVLDAVQSVLAQTLPADEIVVIDDASTDATELLVSSLSHAGVRYVRVNYGHSQLARLAGLRQISADIVCFLDADDQLAPDYLASGMTHFVDDRVGIVFSDVEYFGTSFGRSSYPNTVTRDSLAVRNHLHNGSLVRREALIVSQGLEVSSDDRRTLQDWLLWRRVLRDGWLAKKQSAFYQYRKHPNSLTARLRKRAGRDRDYFGRGGLVREELSMFIPLAGRADLWPRTAEFLNRQLWPHQQIRLTLMDTSQNAEFSQMVRNWVATCDYNDVRYQSLSVGAVGLANLPRRRVAAEVSITMARIYNRMAREVATDYVWVLEDDVIPPLDACERLLKGFDESTASVSAAYRSRLGKNYVAWDVNQRKLARPDPPALQFTGGNGFGCVILRGHIVRSSVFTATLGFAAYDNAFYDRLRGSGFRAKIDWSVECEHRV